jgi:hypothetical protein
MPIIPALWRLRQEDHEFEASLYYIDSVLKKKQNLKQNKKLLDNSMFLS